MAGKATVPVVMVGRYTTFAGASEFETLPIHVVGYETIEIHVWRGRMVADTSFAFRLEESLDQQTWNTLATMNPATETEESYTGSLSSPWLRAVIALSTTSGAYPTATCYAVGLLVKRLFNR